VERIISELGLVGKPMLPVFNKIDLLSKSEREILIAHLASTNDRSRVSISAAKGWGIEELLKAIAQILTKHEVCYVS
jgi:50S ribosomal subunit-associated GTPase HflX